LPVLKSSPPFPHPVLPALNPFRDSQIISTRHRLLAQQIKKNTNYNEAIGVCLSA
jgi:hypothetical protein